MPGRVLPTQFMMCQFSENQKPGKWRADVGFEHTASTVREKLAVSLETWPDHNPKFVTLLTHLDLGSEL